MDAYDQLIRRISDKSVLNLSDFEIKMGGESHRSGLATDVFDFYDCHKPINDVYFYFKNRDDTKWCMKHGKYTPLTESDFEQG
jgi:hypothetical protein